MTGNISAARRKMNRLIGISKLPVQILVTIFDLSLTPTDPAGSRSNGLHALMAVCVDWSQIVKDTPRLWRVITNQDVNYDISDKRAGPNIPLEVCLSWTSGYDSRFFSNYHCATTDFKCWSSATSVDGASWMSSDTKNLKWHSSRTSCIRDKGWHCTERISFPHFDRSI